MIKACFDLYKKNRTKVLYLIYGGFTTVINIAVFWLMTKQLNIDTVLSNSVAWLVSVLFAFITNKLIVFESRDMTLKLIAAELFMFLIARVLSGALDTAIVWYFIDKLHYSELLIKITSNVIVIVLNYVFSKMFIFKKAASD